MDGNQVLAKVLKCGKFWGTCTKNFTATKYVNTRVFNFGFLKAHLAMFLVAWGIYEYRILDH